MKILGFILMMLFSTSAFSQFKSARLQAAGLTCAMCTKAIFESLKQLDIVGEVKPDIKNSEFLITFKKGMNVDPDILKKAVEDAGFSVAALKLTGDFANVKVANDTHVEIGGKTFHFLNTKAQTLSGEKTLTVVDKHYLPSRDFKKFSSATKMSCVESGKAETCCVKEGLTPNTRIYHVTI